MSPYPIEIQRVNYAHQGGTKAYFLTLLQTSEGNSVLIKRWGRVGAFGDVKFETYLSHSEGERAFKSAQNTRGTKGYRVESIDTLTAASLDETTKIIGRPTWAKMDPATLTHIDASLSTKGVREADQPRFTEDGEFIDPQPRKVEISAEDIERDRQARFDLLRAKNPNFGRF